MPNPAQPPQPQDQQDGVEFRKFVGIVNVVNRERLGPDELESAVNIDLDDRGQPHRRRGFKLASAGAFSSGWTSMEGVAYAVKNGSLGIINPDMSFLALQAGLINASVCFVQVGQNIYWSAGEAGLSGIIDQIARTNGPWGKDPNLFLSPVVNPSAVLPAIRGRLIGKPPFATSLAYFNGRIYLAEGRTVWATELYLYDYVEKVTNFLPFENNITMIGAVTDGIYVGTEAELWFLSGPFKEMKRIQVMDSGVIPGSLAYIPMELGNPPQVGLNQVTTSSVSLLFMTKTGYCTAREGGQVYNETETRVVFPAASSAAATYRFQDGMHSYLAVLNSAGTPSDNARIGDHVSAELVRAGTWREITDCASVKDELSYEWIPG